MFKKINFRSKKGMTLAELLIGIGVSAIIMVATITLVNYSFSAYSTTQDNINNDAGLYDTTDIINRYIREAEFCSVKDNSTLYISMSDYSQDGAVLSSKDVRFLYDAASQTLLLDRMDGTPALVVANYITSIKWEIFNNSVRYEMKQHTVTDNNEKIVRGFAYCRGR